MFEIPDPFDAIKRPWTLRPVKVPTDVILVWAAAVTLCAVGTVETFAPFMFEIPNPFETIKRPWMFKPVSVPTDVMFGWAPCDTTRDTVAFATFPYTFEPVKDERAAPFADMLDTAIYEGKSASTRARKDGVPADPIDGPANT
jgi:hypothetical protein